MSTFLSIQSVRFRQRRQGMALISVLAVLLLLTLLVVAFMGRATSARIGAANYKATVRSRMLGDLAVNLVQAQINEATLNTVGTGKTWGSQPGAIRTFNNTGGLDTIYRLYSATTRTTTSLNDLANDIPASASAWVNSPAQWVDLNASAADAEGALHFPILDARNPASLTTPLVIPGFSIAPTAPVTSTQMAPMPVRWIYVLKDGTLISPDPASNGTSLTFNSATVVPSVINPIVGRIAYWTDDDTSKVNINTAAGDDVIRGGHVNPSDSIFWATPMFCAPDEQALALYQPAKGEFQRYSGHPGTVGLNSILSALCGLSAPLSASDFYGLMPRYAIGGSQSATVQVLETGGGAAAIAPAASRLYTSVAEMLFAAGATRTASRLALGSPDPTAGVERANFFLSAHSRAPELNLWGQPRVSIWPVSSLTINRTVEDSLLSFDASVLTTAGVEPFYFQRTDAASTTTDGAIPANKKLLDYLDALTISPIPGFGNSFTENKYPNISSPPKMRQILTEIFDYIRTTNMKDPSATLAQQYGVIYGNYTNEGLYQVMPSVNLNNWSTQGNANFPVLVEASLQFVALGVGQYTLNPSGLGSPTNPAAENPIPPTQYIQNPVASATSPYQNGFLGHDYVPVAIPVKTSTLPPGTANPFTGDAIMADDPAYGALYQNPQTPLVKGGNGGRPADNTTAVQAFLMLSFLEPGLTNAQFNPAFAVSVQGLNGFVINQSSLDPLNPPTALHFPGINGNTTTGQISVVGTENFSSMVFGTDMQGGWDGSTTWGYIPFLFMTGFEMQNPRSLGPSDTSTDLRVPGTQQVWHTGDYGVPNTNRHFPFYSQIVAIYGQNVVPPLPALQQIPLPLKTFTFNGITLNITLGNAHKEGDPMPGNGAAYTVSTYQVNFPASTFPIPQIPSGSQAVGSNPALSANGGGGRVIGTGLPDGNPTTVPYRPDLDDRWTFNDAETSGNSCYTVRIDRHDVVESVLLENVVGNATSWSDARDLALNSVPVDAFIPHPNYTTSFTPKPAKFVDGTLGYTMAQNLLIDNYDTVVGNAGNIDPTQWGTLIKNAAYASNFPASNLFGSTNNQGETRTGIRYPVVPPTLQGAYTSVGGPGDWDNGLGNQTDGPWVNKADEGSLPTGNGYTGYTPYYTVGNGFAVNQASTFSPNRMMPSPVMFGSLPTGIDAFKPKAWQTLLFRPGSGEGNGRIPHPGEPNQPAAGDPADHLLLDLFWMPQAEPYPISEPYSTAGKINLNYQIEPFTYITRATALRALFTGEKVAVMPDSQAPTYKTSDNSGNGGVSTAALIAATKSYDATGETRLPIDPDATLGLSFSGGGGSSGGDPYGSSDFSSTKDPHSTNDFQSGAAAWYDSSTQQTRFFKSPSELCEMFLVPLGYNWQEFSGVTFTSHSWYSIPGDFALVGDNTRERPYADLYERVTTKSNTYTVYFTVQALKNAQPQTDARQATWDETKGAVVGEYRGSNILERYLDPHETMPDFLATGAAGVQSLESYYKWRVVETHQFAP